MFDLVVASATMWEEAEEAERGMTPNGPTTVEKSLLIIRHARQLHLGQPVNTIQDLHG